MRYNISDTVMENRRAGHPRFVNGRLSYTISYTADEGGPFDGTAVFFSPKVYYFTGVPPIEFDRMAL